MLSTDSTVLRVVSICAISWTAWRVFRRYLLKSPLDNLPGPPPHSWLFGNIPQLFTINGWDFYFHILERYGRVMKIRGAFGERILVIFDPRALHYILVKDQPLYEHAELLIARGQALIGEGLPTTLGEQHRKQRKMLNPVFSINHMREMVPIFYEVTERLRVVLKKKVDNGTQEIDMSRWMTRTALELIGQSGMGYSFDSLEDDNDYHPYSVSVKRLTLLAGGPAGFLAAQFLFPLAAKFNFPRLKRFLVERIPLRRVQDLVNVVDTMHKTSLSIIETKKRALHSTDPQVAAEAARKKDIISILLRANASADEKDRLSDSEVLGQVSTFVFAAMDTTSTAVSRILYLLATHPDVQDKLRSEIKEAQSNGQLNYDQLVSLPYLDAVCRETLRVYPPLNIAPPRITGQDMILPLSKPIIGLDGKEMTEIFVPNGTHVLISVLGANCNPDLWGPDSYEWKPERWLSPLPEAVGQAHIPGVYSHLMTFLGGSRGCIGFKFSQLEMKVILSMLLSTFKFSTSDKKICWKLDGVAGPFVEGDPLTRAQLPLRMSLVDRDD